MTSELLTTEELSHRIEYDVRTIRERLRDSVLIEGVHYIRPFGRRKILFLWDATQRYEDLNDHDALRRDPLDAVLAELPDLAAPGAGKSTLNCLELTGSTVGAHERYKQITVDHDAIDQLLVTHFVEAHPTPPQSIVLDLDATDDPVHGAQEGRFFHGYYGHHCYLPLYIFAGEHLLGARLRSSNLDASAGALGKVARIVASLRAA